MEQSRFEKLITAYQEKLSQFQSLYPTQELQDAATDYPVFILPYSISYHDKGNELTETEFAWICNNLTLYDIEFQCYDYNYSLLKKQTNLRFLKIERVKLKDISWVGSLTNLIGLSLENTHIVDISALANCKKLKSLSLLSNDIEDISPIAACHQLRYLDLKDNPIKDIAVLANFKELERLYIRLHHITTIEPLATLPNIQYLEIISQQSISIAPLSQLHSLIKFVLDAEILDNPCDFPLIPNLIHLSIANNKFTKLPPLPDKLEYIDICSNPITDISPLADLKNLRDVYCINNKITTAPPPCLVNPICFHEPIFAYFYDELNENLPPNAQEIWDLLISNDPTNTELAEQLMIGLQWDKTDADAYIRLSKKIKK